MVIDKDEVRAKELREVLPYSQAKHTKTKQLDRLRY